MSSSAAKRRRSAYAAAAAAKQRRQKILVIGGSAILVIVLAFQLPKTLKLLQGSKPAAVPVVATPPVDVRPRILPKEFASAAVTDPFAGRSLSGGDPQVGPSIGGGRDPFAQPGSGAATATVSASQPLPQQIVIGSPTSGGVKTQGWIVILASIPTRDGRSTALDFARKAQRNGLSSISVLNSSNRRPLRGGYWVVYTAPVPTLAGASRRAAEVHAAGYPTAYLRELVVYK